MFDPELRDGIGEQHKPQNSDLPLFVYSLNCGKSKYLQGVMYINQKATSIIEAAFCLCY